MPLSSKWIGPMVGLSCGFLLTFAFLYLSFINAIHDGFRVAAYFFPIAVFISPDLNYLTAGAILFALIQWPIYGLVAAYCYMNRRHPLSAVIVLILVVQHLVIGSVAYKRVDTLPVRMKLGNDLPR